MALGAVKYYLFSIGLEVQGSGEKHAAHLMMLVSKPCMKATASANQKSFWIY